MIEQTLTHSGATRLALIITNYWMARGYQPTVTVEPVRISPERNVWGVRSDMINGHPQKKLRKH